MKEKNKALFFYNPMAGNGMFRSNMDLVIEKFQEKGLQIIPLRAAEFGLLDKVFENMDQDEYRQVIVAGGDGTINVCVNAMLEHGIEVPLSIFPAGTANDFASYFEIPEHIEGMIDVALGEYTIPADVGVVNGKNFINVAALGNMVDVSQKTDPNLKNAIGRFAYYITGATEIPELHAIPVTLTTPEKVYEEEMLFMIVMNGSSAGGFRKLSPESEINDGLLNVILFKHMPIPVLMPLALKVLRGEHLEDKRVLTFKTSELLIESPEDIPTDIDGEHGEKIPLKFEVKHDAINIFVSKEEREYYERFINLNN